MSPGQKSGHNHPSAGATKEPAGTCRSGGPSVPHQHFISARKKKKICLGSLCFKVCCSPLRNVLGNRGKVLGAQDGISVLVGLHEAPTSLLHLSFKVSGSF